LDRVRVLSSARRRSRVKAAAIGALKELKSLGSWRTPGSTQEDIQEVLRGETSLADYPYATILTSVSHRPFLSFPCPLQIAACIFLWALMQVRV
jgi:hypothetical protein